VLAVIPATPLLFNCQTAVALHVLCVISTNRAQGWGARVPVPWQPQLSITPSTTAVVTAHDAGGALDLSEQFAVGSHWGSSSCASGGPEAHLMEQQYPQRKRKLSAPLSKAMCDNSKPWLTGMGAEQLGLHVVLDTVPVLFLMLPAAQAGLTSSFAWTSAAIGRSVGVDLPPEVGFGLALLLTGLVSSAARSTELGVGHGASPGGGRGSGKCR